jgi:hypothetical protein
MFIFVADAVSEIDGFYKHSELALEFAHKTGIKRVLFCYVSEM